MSTETHATPDGTTSYKSKNGQIIHVSHKKYKGKSVIIIDNNITYMPKDMFSKKIQKRIID